MAHITNDKINWISLKITLSLSAHNDLYLHDAHTKLKFSKTTHVRNRDRPLLKNIHHIKMSTFETALIWFMPKLKLKKVMGLKCRLDLVKFNNKTEKQMSET